MKKTNVSRLLVSLLALCLMLSMTPAVFAANDLVVETGSDVSISSSTDYDSITVTGGKLTISNSEIGTTLSGTKTITISGGEVVLTDAIISAWSSSVINISGGTVTGTGEYEGHIGSDPTLIAAGTVNITGGIIDIPMLAADLYRLSINGNTVVCVDSLVNFFFSDNVLTDSGKFRHCQGRDHPPRFCDDPKRQDPEFCKRRFHHQSGTVDC